MSTNFYINFLYFIIYSIFGWICEVIFCSVEARKFINRGFLNGPLCPIYGFGALAVIAFLTPFKNSVILVFLLGMLYTSVLEYITSFVMEKLFHSKWWDYSKNKFNINGRVCLLNSILFGLLSVFVIYFFHVQVQNVISHISYLWIQILSISIIIILTVDITVTVQTVIDLNEKMRKLRELSMEIKEKLDEKHLFMESMIAERIALLKENFENLDHGKEVYAKLERVIKEFNQIVAGSKLLQRRLLHAFPEMKSIKFQEQLQSIKNEINKRIKKAK